MKGIYRFAGHCVEIDFLFTQVHALCAPYRSDRHPEYTVRTAWAGMIEGERL